MQKDLLILYYHIIYLYDLQLMNEKNYKMSPFSPKFKLNVLLIDAIYD